LKLADFGFSKLVSPVDGKESPKVQLGTPNYMSPQILNSQEYGVKTDVWSAGIVFYETIFGRLPWRGKDMKDLFFNIKNTPMTFSIDKPISETTKDLMGKMLTIDESKRINWLDMIKHPAFSQFRRSITQK